jgi:hypothetical protein
VTARPDQLRGSHAPADAGGAAAGGVSSLNLPPPAPAGGGPFPGGLPSRRPAVTERIYWPIDQGGSAALGALGRKVFLTAGFDASGRVLEVFLRGGSKHGERIDFALDELAIDISQRLQAGATLLQLLTTVAMHEMSAHLVGDVDAPRLPAIIVIEAILHRLVQIECWANEP